jgi:signal transduction histidine kinase
VWVSSSVFAIVPDPAPLYIVAATMLVYNSLFAYYERRRRRSGGDLDWNIFLQTILDQIALTLLLYFSSIPYNPFIFYFVFHMIIATLLLRGWAPYSLATSASLLVGAVLILEYLGWIPVFGLELPDATYALSTGQRRMDKLYLAGFFFAFSSTLWITVYLTSSVHRYMRRAQAMVRQREKMLGIGQLVAGIAHQISNPLDGIQNCLSTIGKSVKDDERLSQYVRLMTEALERIERTAKRVQSFARPRGLKLQNTDVNKAVNTTVELLGNSDKCAVEIATEFGQVPLVMGDPYTLQEVIFNLCTNALVAMPNGGTLSIRTFALEAKEFGRFRNVAIEVADTGIGIAEALIDKIFEPFFTTRANAGGTGLGLTLCRMLISEMGGRIDVKSEVGKGTTFRIILTTTDIETERGENEDSGS